MSNKRFEIIKTLEDEKMMEGMETIEVEIKDYREYDMWIWRYTQYGERAFGGSKRAISFKRKR